MTSKIVALTNQLQQDLEDGEIGEGFTVDQLLDFFQQYDVILDVNDLYNMIRVPPLKGLIKNIQGDNVIFVGQEEEKTNHPETGDNKETVKKMAKRATKI